MPGEGNVSALAGSKFKVPCGRNHGGIVGRKFAGGEKDRHALHLGFAPKGRAQLMICGYASADTKSINGLEVIVITRATVDAVREQIRQDWQKRGLGGIVSAKGR